MSDPLDAYRRLAPGPRERGFIVGATGCGKTTLAKRVLRCHYCVVAIDPKITLGSTPADPTAHLAGYKLCRTPDDLADAGRKYRLLQYRPDPEFQHLDDYDEVYRWVFDRKRTFLYTDEILLVSGRREVPDAMRACITSGRERDIGMLSGTQRPAQIDMRLVTESECFYTFQLRRKVDRERMAELMEDDLILEEPAEGHCFWYRRQGEPAEYLEITGLA